MGRLILLEIIRHTQEVSKAMMTPPRIKTHGQSPEPFFYSRGCDGDAHHAVDFFTLQRDRHIHHLLMQGFAVAHRGADSDLPMPA